MKPKIALKIGVDTGMTAALLFLMPYELVGQTAHEWLGIGIFILFLLHHILNRQWGRNMQKGSYTPLRIWQTLLVALLLVFMAGSMVSGIILSRHVLSFLPINGGRSMARKLHMLSAYWGFVLMGLHLGFHWSMMLGMAEKALGKPSAIRTWLLRILGLVIAGYGAFAFVKREIGNYMLLKILFVFFDFEEPLIWFLLDYAAVMGLFVFIGHYLTKLIKLASRRRNRI